MIRCLTCDVTLAFDADSPQFGRCPTCGGWLQITCKRCHMLSSAHSVVQNMFRCPHCNMTLIVPGPSIARLSQAARGKGLVWFLLAAAALVGTATAGYCGGGWSLT